MRQIAAVAALALAGCAAGCGGPDTTVNAVVEILPGDPAPRALTASVFDAHRVLARGPVAPGPLPGTILVRGLPAVNQPVRLVVASDAAAHELGGARVETIARRQVDATLLLSAATPDADGDGVPDDLDDCPHVADPDQLSLDGVIGDACRGDGGIVDGLDLPNGGDLAGSFCGGPSRCAGAGAALCEGFESAALPQPWMTLMDSGRYAVETGRACRGTFAIHFSTAAAAGTRVRTLIFQEQVVPQSSYYVRAFFYLPSPPLTDGAVLFTTYQLASPFGNIELLAAANGKLFLSDSTGGANPQKLSATTLPTDRWACLELGLVSDAANGTLRVWLDDAPVADLAIGPPANTQPSPSFGALAVGMAWNPGPALPARDLWLDEVAVDTQRIGCAR